MSGKARKDHLILTISYALDVVDCSCGWSGKAANGTAWAQHRSETGTNSTRSVQEWKVRTGQWSSVR